MAKVLAAGVSLILTLLIEFEWQVLKYLDKLLCFVVLGFAISGMNEEHE